MSSCTAFVSTMDKRKRSRANAQDEDEDEERDVRDDEDGQEMRNDDHEDEANEQKAREKNDARREEEHKAKRQRAEALSFLQLLDAAAAVRNANQSEADAASEQGSSFDNLSEVLKSDPWCGVHAIEHLAQKRSQNLDTVLDLMPDAQGQGFFSQRSDLVIEVLLEGRPLDTCTLDTCKKLKKKGWQCKAADVRPHLLKHSEQVNTHLLKRIHAVMDPMDANDGELLRSMLERLPLCATSADCLNDAMVLFLTDYLKDPKSSMVPFEPVFRKFQENGLDLKMLMMPRHRSAEQKEQKEQKLDCESSDDQPVGAIVRIMTAAMCGGQKQKEVLQIMAENFKKQTGRIPSNIVSLCKCLLQKSSACQVTASADSQGCARFVPLCWVEQYKQGKKLDAKRVAEVFKTLFDALRLPLTGDTTAPDFSEVEDRAAYWELWELVKILADRSRKVDNKASLAMNVVLHASLTDSKSPASEHTRLLKALSQKGRRLGWDRQTTNAICLCIVSTGDVTKLENLVMAKADINAMVHHSQKGYGSTSPLRFACRKAASSFESMKDCIRKLVESEADVKEMGKHDCKPLLEMCRGRPRGEHRAIVDLAYELSEIMNKKKHNDFDDDSGIRAMALFYEAPEGDIEPRLKTDMETLGKLCASSATVDDDGLGVSAGEHLIDLGPYHLYTLQSSKNEGFMDVTQTDLGEPLAAGNLHNMISLKQEDQVAQMQGLVEEHQIERNNDAPMEQASHQEHLKAGCSGVSSQASAGNQTPVPENDNHEIQETLSKLMETRRAEADLLKAIEPAASLLNEAKDMLAEGRSNEVSEIVDKLSDIKKQIKDSESGKHLIDEGKQVNTQMANLLESRILCLQTTAEARRKCMVRTEKVMNLLTEEHENQGEVSKPRFAALFTCLQLSASVGLIPLPGATEQEQFTKLLRAFMATLRNEGATLQSELEVIIAQRLVQDLKQHNDLTWLIRKQEKGGFGADSLETCCSLLQKQSNSFQERAKNVLKTQAIGAWPSRLDALGRMTIVLDTLPLESPRRCLKLMREGNTQALKDGSKAFDYLEDCLSNSQHQLVPKEILDQCASSDFSKSEEGIDKLSKNLHRNVSSGMPHLEFLLKATSHWTEGVFSKLGLRVVPHQTQHAALLLAMKYFDDIKHGGKKSKHAAKCLIEEIGTGEGKSLVIALLALYIATKGKAWHGNDEVRVHVLIDNISQLERDFMEFVPMFQAFLPTSQCCVVMSGEEYEKRKRENDPVSKFACKEIPLDKSIVYCQAKHVQGVYAKLARDKGEKKKHTGFGFEVFQDAVIILDEVDSLIIDEEINDPYLFQCNDDLCDFARKVAKACKCRRLGGVIPKNPMQLQVYNAIAEIFKNIRKVQHQKHGEISVSTKVFRQDTHDERKAYKEVIKGKLEVDSWSLTGECLTYNAGSDDAKFVFKETLFIASRPSVIKGYRAIFGMSGSVGSEGDRKFIKQLYNATCFSIPRFLEVCELPPSISVKTKQLPSTSVRTQLEAECRGIFQCPNEDLYDEIVKHASACTQEKKVPVLVITRTADEARSICQHCEKKKDLWVQKQSELDGEETSLYIRDLSWHTYETDYTTYGKYVDEACKPGQVEITEGDARASRVWRTTITDGKGGRGTDYRCDDPAVEKQGGLMLILVNPPTNVRDFVQWLGRTARQGNPGQFIILFTADKYKTAEDLLNKCKTPFASPKKLSYERCFPEELKIFKDMMLQCQAQDDERVHRKARLQYWKGEIMCELSKTRVGATDTSKPHDYLFSTLCMSFQDLTMQQIFAAMKLLPTEPSVLQKLEERRKVLERELMVEAIDEAIDSLPVKKQRFPWPRLLVLMLDRTMQQTACQSQIVAVQQAIQDEVHLLDQDSIAVYGLGDGWMLTPQRLENQGNRQRLSKELKTYMFPAGTPCLWESLLHCVKTMHDCITSSPHPLRCSLLIVSDSVDDGMRFGGSFPQSLTKCLLSQQGFQEEVSVEGYKRKVGKLPHVITVDHPKVKEVKLQNDNEPVTSGWVCELQPMASEPLKEDLKEFLESLTKAGTRNGQVTVSLGWAAKHDLDLHLNRNRSNWICWEKRCVEEGSFHQVLDCDMKAETTIEGKYRVENIFLDNFPEGPQKNKHYVVDVHNYTGEARKVGQKVDFFVVIRTSPQIRMKIYPEGESPIETFGNSLSQILYTFSSSVSVGKEFKKAFEFEVLARTPIQNKIQEGCTAIMNKCKDSPSASFDTRVIDISNSRLSTWLPSKDPEFYVKFKDKGMAIKAERKRVQDETRANLENMFGKKSFAIAQDQQGIAGKILEFCRNPSASFSGATL
eukprot:TRINITY_DN42_c0_g2_i1.p1 TRINITY_DN42_c0_g2~~TRINITY_DN42_c0_g2_i1.p1  ORF type:complete len:2307 (-),score=416.85 TRINITY_DN42_c0_g2_i1:215-7135(-)